MFAELPAQPARSRAWLAMLIIIAAGLVAYHNSFRGVFIFDDEHNILENPHVRHLWPITRAMSAPPQSGVAGRPVIALTLAFNYALGGLDPWGYHAFNLAVHLLCGLLLFGIVRRTLSGQRLKEHYERSATMLGMIVAILWLIHPLQTESVTYIITRTEVLMGFFCLLTLYCVIRASRSSRPAAWHVAAVISCALGMACKEVMVVVPLLVLFYDRIFESPSITQALRRRWGLYAGLAATWLFLAALNASSPRSASVGFAHGVTAFGYAKNQCLAIITYLHLAFWPHPLIVDYGFPETLSIREVLPQGLAVAGLLIVTLAALRVRPMIGFLGAWFFIILAPTSSFVPISTEVAAERRMYLPLAAVCTLVVLGANAALDAALVWRRWRNTAKVGLVLGAATVLAGLTIDRNRDYLSGVALWSQAVRVRPNNWRIHFQLGRELREAGRIAEAVSEATTALEMNPQYTDTYKLLGSLAGMEGRSDDAVRYYQEALHRGSDSAEVQNNLGVLLAGKGAIDDAIMHLREAVRLKPDLADAQQNLGILLVQRQEPGEAVPHFQQAVRLSPNDADLRCQLARAYARLGRLSDAVGEYDAALRLQPNRDDVRRERDAAMFPRNAP